MSSNEQKPERPLSPHLTIYRPQMTTMLSILHRITGVLLITALLAFIWWLVAAATGPESYNQFLCYASSGFGQLLMIGGSFALYYHLCNGIRHLVWDTGRLFEIEDAKRAGYLVLFSAVALTVITWLEVYNG